VQDIKSLALVLGSELRVERYAIEAGDEASYAKETFKALGATDISSTSEASAPTPVVKPVGQYGSPARS